MRHMAAKRISDPSYGAKTDEMRQGAKMEEKEGETRFEGDDRDGGACIRKYVLFSYERLERSARYYSPAVIISPCVRTPMRGVFV